MQTAVSATQSDTVELTVSGCRKVGAYPEGTRRASNPKRMHRIKDKNVSCKTGLDLVVWWECIL